MPNVHTQRRWLGVARHADECQLQLDRRATGYWLVLFNVTEHHVPPCLCRKTFSNARTPPVRFAGEFVVDLSRIQQVA